MNEAQIISRLALGMSVVLGMSYEDVLARCTIREMLLYTGTLMSMQQATEQPQTGDPELDRPIDDRINEVMLGN